MLLQLRDTELRLAMRLGKVGWERWDARVGETSLAMRWEVCIISVTDGTCYDIFAMERGASQSSRLVITRLGLVARRAAGKEVESVYG